MEIGMLWFDDSPRALEEKIHRAVAYYVEKYGRAPTLCLVNPATLAGSGGSVSGVQLKQTRSVMRDHFLVGVAERARPERSARQMAA